MANKRKNTHDRTVHLNTTVPGGHVDRLGRAADIEQISISEANTRAIEMYCDAVEGNNIDYLIKKHNELLANIEAAQSRVNAMNKRIDELQTIKKNSERQIENIEEVRSSLEYKQLLESISNRYARLILNKEPIDKSYVPIAEHEKEKYKIYNISNDIIIEDAKKLANEKVNNREWREENERR